MWYPSHETNKEPEKESVNKGIRDQGEGIGVRSVFEQKLRQA